MNEPAMPLVLVRMQERIAEEKRWAEQNPALARAWSEALEEDGRLRVEAQKKRAAEMLVKSISDRLPRMGVPQRLADEVQRELSAPVSERRFWETKAMRAARRFIEERKTFLVLLGGAGAGKSGAASWVLTHPRRKVFVDYDREDAAEVDSHAGLFIRAAEASRIPRFVDDASEDRWSRALHVAWLVVDDLGIETMNDYWSERVNELIDTRYGDMRRTVLTSNLGVDAFKARYGERIVSRLRDDALIVDVGSEDLRRASC